MSEMPYRSIACGLYDRLEALATRRVAVEVVWQGDDGTEHRAIARLDDLFSDGEGEWLRLDDGRTVRLDRLVGTPG